MSAFIAVHFSELTKENKTIGFSHIGYDAEATRPPRWGKPTAIDIKIYKK
ncbi:MAG: hypothetical protein KKG06_05875 [Bacteroidetes bacterium]|nr:hypothetical protein [Bacteroidota bacterium]